MKRVLSIVVLLIAVGLIASVVFNNQPAEGVEVGNTAIDFTLPMWQGDEGSLSDYRGDIVVVNLWASWCPPCRKEMPDLMRFHHDYQKQGVTVLGVNMYMYERREMDAENFLNEFNVDIPMLFDDEGFVARTYVPYVLPTTFILDKKGVIRTVINGEVNYERLEQIIEPLL